SPGSPVAAPSRRGRISWMSSGTWLMRNRRDRPRGRETDARPYHRPMPAPPPTDARAELRRLLAAEPAAQRILADARRLTGGSRTRDPERSTLLACSGGADSSALVLAIAASPIP